MLTEKDYCDYETCVALKELGFREKCPTYYDTEDNVGLLFNTQWTSDYLPCQFTDCLESHNSNTSDDNSYIDAPTMWEAQKWLREEKKIIIEATFNLMYKGQPRFSWRVLYNLTQHKGAYYTLDSVMSKEDYDSYEEALSEGVKCAVKILKEK